MRSQFVLFLIFQLLKIIRSKVFSVWGCNQFVENNFLEYFFTFKNSQYATSKEHPYFGDDDGCSNSSLIIPSPVEISFAQNDIKQACATNLNTVILTKSNKIFVFGSDFDKLMGNNIFPSFVQHLSYNGEAEYYTDPITQLHCGSRQVFFIKRSGRMFCFGINNIGICGVGHANPIKIPQLSHEEVHLFNQHSFVSGVVPKSKKNFIYTSGWGVDGQLGRVSPVITSDFLLVNATLSMLEEGNVKFLSFTARATFAVFENEKIYMWGASDFLADGYSYPSGYVDIPQLTSLKDIPSNGINITDIFGKFFVVYVLFKDVSRMGTSKRINRLFSWGEMSKKHSCYYGREVNISNWFLALEVNYGEIPSDEEIVSAVNDNTPCTRVITDVGKIYAFGVNAYGLFGMPINPHLNVSSFVRVLIDFEESVEKPISFKNNEYYHFIVKYGPDDAFDLLWLWITLSSSFFLLIFLFILFFLIVLVILVIFLLFNKQNKTKESEVELETESVSARKSGIIGKSNNLLVKIIDKYKKRSFGKESKEEIELFLKFALKKDSQNIWKTGGNVFEKNVKIIKYDSLKLKDYLGAGGSGCSIFLADLKNEEGNVKEVAFKSYPIIPERVEDLFDSKSSVFEDFKREMKIYFNTSHPYVLKLEGIVLETKSFGIVMEYCLCGDLKKFITNNSIISLEDRYELLYKIASGMAHLHFNDIIHRDLKLQNILIDEYFNPKIMDFGLSRLIKTSMTKTRNVGTEKFQAPELVMSGKYDNKVDVFSYAIVAFELLTLNFDPFNAKNYDGNIAIKIATDPNFRPKKEFLKNVDKWIVDLICKCWDHVPYIRPSFSEICKLFLSKGKISKSEMFVEKEKKSDPITIYVMEENQEFENAEDVELSVFKVEELLRIGKEKFSERSGNCKVFLKNEEDLKEITIDEEVKRLKGDNVLVFRFVK